MHAANNDRGSVIVLATLMIVLLLLMVGMGLDTGHLAYIRSQGQPAVDAAALAAASAVPSGVDNTVYDRVQRFNSTNDYLGTSDATKRLKNESVTFVQYNPTTQSITKVDHAIDANGVQVAIENTNPYAGTTSGAIRSPLFLTPLFNLLGLSTPTTADVSVSAIAYVQPIPGLPIALAGCPLPNPVA